MSFINFAPSKTLRNNNKNDIKNMNKNKKENSGEEVFLTTKQASEFTGYKESYLRKLTMRRQIAFFRVGSRSIRFSKSDLINFMTKCRVPSDVELQAKAELNLAMKGGRL